MNLIFRVLWILFSARGRGRLTPVDESIIHLRVLPNDLDIHIHMNNGRYLSVMDLGRLDLITRCGLGRLALQQRWVPLVAAAGIRYRRPLKLFERFALHTRIVYWDEKWFYVAQRFERDGQTIATARVRGLLRGPQGNIAPHIALEALGYPHLPAPPPPTDLHEYE